MQGFSISLPVSLSIHKFSRAKKYLSWGNGFSTKYVIRNTINLVPDMSFTNA